ncbi:MAG: alanine--glyoxylate aminotransferase family protein [Limnochordales bacterium]|nr:aminotransferase [Bacillota bacterium]REJ37427.1 MAG: aminotransferase [Bacillota bacterium]
MQLEQQHLRIPGPTPVPPRVMRAAARPVVNHRGAAFRELYKQVTAELKNVFQTQGEVMIITGSGTAAMEAAVVNLVSPGEKVLVLVGGKFGERWGEIARAYGAQVIEWRYDWRQGAEPEELARRLAADPDIVAVFATHNESSTGVMNDIEGLSRARDLGGRRHRALLIVDSVSALGGAPLPMDAWGVDAVVTGSQKCLMVPPGLSFVALGQRALERLEQVTTGRYYLDLRAYRKAAAAGESPYTPAVTLVFALQEALAMLAEEGLENSFARHRLMRDMVRAGIKALGLPLWTDERWASPTVTAVEGAPGLEVEPFRKLVRDRFGVELAGGQGELKGRIFRIGHMGYAGPLDMIAALAAIEQGLAASGFPVKLGAGVAAAQEVWARWA